MDFSDGFCMILLKNKKYKKYTMTNNKNTNVLREFIQEFIHDLEKFLMEFKASESFHEETKGKKSTAFNDFIQDVQENWEAHWIRTTTLRLLEAIKKIKKDKKKFKT